MIYKILYKSKEINYNNFIYKKAINSKMEGDQIFKEINNVNKKYNYNFGRPIWYLFHTLAIKVKDEIFLSFRDELLNIIMFICKNIVCPTCAEHSTEYLEKINFLKIETKEKLNFELFKFHNIVNDELITKYNQNIELFLYENLEPTYKNNDTQQIIQNFLKYDFYEKKYHVNSEEKMLYLTKWFSDNFDKFDN